MSVTVNGNRGDLVDAVSEWEGRDLTRDRPPPWDTSTSFPLSSFKVLRGVGWWGQVGPEDSPEVR